MVFDGAMPADQYYVELQFLEDLFLVDANGTVVYSTNKDERFGINLLSAEHRDL